MRRTKLFRATFLALACSATMVVSAQSNVAKPIDVPAGDLVSALTALAKQSGVEIIYRADQLKGVHTNGVRGTLSTDDAIVRILEGSGYGMRRDASGAIVIVKAGKATPKAPVKPGKLDEKTKAAPNSERTITLPEILVQGSRSLNVDIARTEDDIQPYVVFQSEDIEGSMAANIEEFFSTRLPMNQTTGTASRNQPETDQGNRSRFNLRGLGANQTLILVNGRRAPGVSTLRTGDMDQPDINGIPLAAIERIEVLPATASGIYGGGATGGVINVILKSDYQGGRVKLTYDNSFDTDTGRRRLDLSTGFSLFGGKTQVALFGSYSDANDLLVRDRDFAKNGRRLAIENAPELVFSNLYQVNGAQTNFATFSPFLKLSDGTVLGSNIGTVPVGYAGPDSDGGVGLLAGIGTFNTEIPKDISGGGQGLSTVPTTYSGYASVKHNFSDRLDAYLDLGRTTNKSVTRWSGYGGTAYLRRGNAGNPFNNFVVVYYSLPGNETPNLSISKTERANGGIVFRVSPEWTAGLDFNWNESESSTSSSSNRFDTDAINAAISNGSIDVFSDTSLFPHDLSAYLTDDKSVYGPAKGELNEISARISGTIAKTAAGNATLTATLSRRREEAAATYEGRGPYRYLPSRHQDISSEYVEAAFPLVASSQGIPFIDQLDLQTSVRRDAYETVSVPAAQSLEIESLHDPIPPFEYSSTNFSSADYTVGFRYRPMPSLTLRGSIGTGFLPPSLAQISGIAYETELWIADPRRGGEYGVSDPMMVTFSGGSAVLKPERSRSTSFGLIYSPESIEQFRISLDYTRIEKTDEITQISYQEIIDMEDMFPGRVIRGDRHPGDPADWAGSITAIDASAVNISKSDVGAFDLQMDKEWWSGDWGQIHLYGVVSYQSNLDRKLLPESEVQNKVGYSDGILKWRGNFGINWTKGRLRISANTSYYDGYKVFSSYDSPEVKGYKSRLQGSDMIPCQSYTDVSMAYKFQTGWLADSSLNVGIRNVFNRKPPTVATLDTRGGYSTYGDPRLSTYVLSFEHNF